MNNWLKLTYEIFIFHTMNIRYMWAKFTPHVEKFVAQTTPEDAIIPWILQQSFIITDITREDTEPVDTYY